MRVRLWPRAHALLALRRAVLGRDRLACVGSPRRADALPAAGGRAEGAEAVSEPEIVINGVRLTEAQAATVRVAVADFQRDLLLPASCPLGEISDLYLARLAEILAIMFYPKRPHG